MSRDLFIKTMCVAIHKATDSEIVIETTEWYNGEINYKCLVPMKDEKGKWQLCGATYNESEIQVIY